MVLIRGNQVFFRGWLCYRPRVCIVAVGVPKLMKRKYERQLAFALVWAVCAISMAAQTKAVSSHQSRSSSDQGAQSFSAYCASCHGLDGRGGERAPDIATARKLQKA